MQMWSSSVRVAGVWCAVVAVLAACAAALGAPVSNNAIVLMAVVMLMPSAVVVALWRREPATSVNDVLHPSEPAGKP